MEVQAHCGHSLYWHNCYRGTYDLIAPDSYAHPAKMSPALCYRILQHLQELGLLKDSDIVLDPMAGTGITNICAGAMGFPSISVEFEERFINFQSQNKEYAERRLCKSLEWRMIQGDSRKLGELLQGDGLKSVTSPPYGHGIHEVTGLNRERFSNPARIGKLENSQVSTKGYGETEGQIGNLKDTPLKSITSPPYQDALPNGLDRKAAETMVQAMYDKHGRSYSKEDFDYQVELILKRSNREYGEAEGQIGKFKDKPLKSITSPPYGDAVSSEKTGIDFTKCAGGRDRTKEPAYNKEANNPTSELRYSEDDENIGNLMDGVQHQKERESYLEAMRKVYSEITKVSDVLTVVIKNPTRGGKLRWLDLDTIKILERAGWKIHCQHRALLFEELEQADLFGQTQKKVRGRLSFFKRLSWQKEQPIASWEDILVAVRK